MIKGLLSCFLLTSLSTSALAQENYPYRPPHDEVCYELSTFKIKCGDFHSASKILAKKYDTVSTGADVAASFSARTHPGDRPFLNRLATRLGYLNMGNSLAADKPISDWGSLTNDEKNALVTGFGSIGNTPNAKEALAYYLRHCIHYWNSPDAVYDDRIELPTLAEVSALCIADSGVLR